jgi:alkanesulfonate monooxygenase SsuD/methylene tetrahydromethanopterin reductase-like flavin-dependent oxidoreductase (luciferase family)
VRLSLCVDPGRPWRDVRALAGGAEAIGLDRVYICDHFMPSGDPRGSMLECITTIAALGACTSRIGLGPLVLGNTYRHPAVVANIACTLDHATNGRFVLGLGAGCQVNEHSAYGIALPPPAERVDRLAEACEVIRRLLAEDVSTFAGRWYRLVDARCEPKPLGPVPLLIGGGGERRTLRVAARFADEWHAWGQPDVFAHKNEVLDEHCRAAGRDPATLARSTGGELTGRADEDIELLSAYAAVGADEYIVRDDRTRPIEPALKLLAGLR